MEFNSYKVEKKLNNNFKISFYTALFWGLFTVSFLVAIIILLDFDRPRYYDALFLLPLSFTLIILVNVSNLEKCLTQFGTLLIVVLEFIRLVIIPLFLTLSNYFELITLNVDKNTPQAIALLVYEALVIAIALKLPTRVKKPYKTNYKLGIRRLNIFMAVYTITVIVTFAITPEILLAHRTILGVFTDSSYTSMTLDSVVALYPSGYKHYVIIISRFLFTPYRLLLPAYIIILIHHYKKRNLRVLSWIISLFPFVVVSDVIAQSIYFSLFLLLLNCYLYKVKLKTIVLVICLSGVAVLAYFIGREFANSDVGSDSNFIENFTRRLVSYFSGLNMVSGAFNQPADLSNKYQYFLYDFLKAIPFNNTLLGLDQSISSMTLFNKSNMCDFQIPTTIGMCYYYFGFIFAPLYSFALARIAKRSSIKMAIAEIPLLKLVYTFCAFIFALGIVMYNIEIVCNMFVQVIFPIYIVARLSFRRSKQ